MTGPSPPRMATWVAQTLIPAARRTAALEALADGFRAHVLARGPAEGRRWYLAQTTEYVWAASRLGAAAAVLAFLTHGNLSVVAPWSSASWWRWLSSTWPELLLLLATARTAWQARSWTAGLLSGALASCVVTLGAQVAFVAAVAIGQPRLFRMGLTWDTLRDLVDIFVRSSATGIVVAAVGGLLGAIGGRAQTSTRSP